MKKILSTVLIFVFSLSCLAFPVAALQLNTVDGSGYITDDEMQSLQEIAVRIENTYDYFTMISIAENIGTYESVSDYAASLYDAYSTAENAVVFVHNLETNKCDFYIREETEGLLFDDDVINQIFDDYNATETYYLGAKSFYENVESILMTAAEQAGAVLAETTQQAEQESVQTSTPDVEVTVSVAEETTAFVRVDRVLPLVVDYADILTDAQEQELLAICEAFTEEYKAEIAIVTVLDLEGKTQTEYADDFYDYNGYGYGENDDGLLVLYKPGAEGDRKLAITTHGTARENISDEEITEIIDSMIAFLVYDNYEDAFDTFLVQSEAAIQGMPAVLWLLICLAVGLVIGLLITNVLASSNKSVRQQTDAADYVRAGSLMITHSNDVFTHSRVSATPKAKSNSSGEGSSHTSSSGRSHGGGSATF